MVTAAANGSTIITATGASGDPGATITITVSQAVATLSATTTSFTFINQIAQATAKDSNLNPIPASSLTWTACDSGSPPCAASAVVSVSAAGSIKAIGNGNATVYAFATGSTDVPVSLAVTVAQALAKVVVSPSSATIAVSGTQPFTAQPQDSGGTAITGLSATWQSSDPTIAKIDASTGVAMGVKNGGPITITATISTTASTKSGTAQLTVTVTYTLPWHLNDTTANLTINAGDSVQWNITDTSCHSSTSCSSASHPAGCPAASGFSWDTGVQCPGVTLGPVKFTTPGIYVYCCTPHGCGSMTGTITVQ
jgi:plastocyanin